MPNAKNRWGKHKRSSVDLDISHWSLIGHWTLVISRCNASISAYTCEVSQ